MKRLAVILFAAGCVEELPLEQSTQSIEVEMVSPARNALGGPGPTERLPDSQRMIVVNLRAKDASNNVDTAFSAQLRVHAQFLGTLTPRLYEMPLATIQMTNGVATNQTIMLPDSVFGATTLWIDNGTGLGPDYVHGAVTGTSQTLWYRDPFIADLQRPESETALDALSSTPLQDKQVRVGTSRYGTRGALVVTSTFAQGYTVSDVECATGAPGPTPPCTAQDYDHVMVFTFSAPRDGEGRPLEVGAVIDGFAGGLSEFNGLTEIGFPRTFTSEGYAKNTALLPEPVLFDPAWFGPLSDPAGRINFERNEAGAIEVRNAKVCPIDDAPDGVYTRYKQWTIDPSAAGDQCGTSNVLNLITAGTDFTTDPRTLVGTTLARVVGIVRPVNIGSFNVWILYPRGASDVDLQ